jgi:hypothetical protein
MKMPMNNPHIDMFRKATIPMKMMMLDDMYKIIKDMALNDCKQTQDLSVKFKTLSKEEKAQVIADMHGEVLKLMKILKRHVNKMCAETNEMIEVLKAESASSQQGDFWKDWPGRN